MSRSGPRQFDLIYFIKPIGMTGPVKIGCSVVPEKRLIELSVWSPFPLELAVAIPGGMNIERILHATFAEDHSHKEWFHASDRLLELISKLKAGKKLEDCIDFGCVDELVRANTKPKFTGDQRRQLSYSSRIRHAIKRANRANPEARVSAPADIEAILAVWQGSSYCRIPGVTPSEAEIGRLDQFLANLERHVVSIRPVVEIAA